MRFELTIWECAEHWLFYDIVEADSEVAARLLFKKNYGKGYFLRRVHAVD